MSKPLKAYLKDKIVIDRKKLDGLELKNILNNLYQDANAMTMFDATIANFTVRKALEKIKQYLTKEQGR